MNEEQAKLTIRVHPGASRNMITGYTDGILNIKLTTRPEKGKANDSLVRYLSDLLGIAKSKIIIQKGIVSRKKILLVDGFNTEEISLRISAHINKKDS